MNQIISFSCILFLFIGCVEINQKDQITDRKDYIEFLQASKDLSKQHENIALWELKINQEPRGFLYYEKLAGTYNDLFEKTRDLTYLYKADSVFKQSEKLTRGKWKVSSLLSLSSLSIKKHDFKSAVNYAVRARDITDEKFGPLLMQFDAEMELGNYQMAGSILSKNRRLESFDYLVRLSKFKDYQGDLDSAIYYMEKAECLIKDHHVERKIWVTSNLGDMYGHAGRIQASYKKYLEALNLNPSYDYALKGIAWIAYSNDRNMVEAKRILEALSYRSQTPDYYLMLAEINELEGNSYESEFYKEMFLKEASSEKYGDMYNKYLIQIHIDDEELGKALSLAQTEVESRPTPEAYNWLAWTLYHGGDFEKALNIYEEFVEGKTYEPEVVYHMGVVYHHTGHSRGLNYLKESLEASYELGPLTKLQIESILKS